MPAMTEQQHAEFLDMINAIMEKNAYLTKMEEVCDDDTDDYWNEMEALTRLTVAITTFVEEL